jgi:hypothetical protein
MLGTIEVGPPLLWGPGHFPEHIMTSRRTFLLKLIPATGLALAAGRLMAAPAAASESDPAAQALGYRADATKVDKQKFPRYAAGQQCSGCALYGGKPTDVSAPCPALAGKLVAGKGWCSAWVKKG